MEHCRFEFWIIIFESWWCDLELPKDGTYGKRIWFLDTQFWESNNSCRYFVQNHKFCFDIPYILFYLFWFHFNKIWNFVVIIIEFLVKQKSTYFYCDFHIYIIVWIFYNINNVMKWIIILFLDFSTLYYEMQILVIWNNSEYNALMNCKIRCV
jgi:hypothetical protein